MCGCLRVHLQGVRLVAEHNTKQLCNCYYQHKSHQNFKRTHANKLEDETTEM